MKSLNFLLLISLCGAVMSEIPATIYSNLIKKSPESFGIVDNNMKILDGSSTFEDSLSSIPQDIIKKCLEYVEYNRLPSYTCDLGRYSSNFQSAAITTSEKTSRILHRTKTMYFGIHLIAAPYEISRVNSKRSSKFNADLFYLLCDTIEDYAIIMLDTNGDVMTWNKGAERMKLCHSTEIVGQHFSVFFTDEDVKNGEPDKELRVALRNQRFHRECWRKKKDGTLFWASVTLTALHKDGKHIGFGKVTRDLTSLQSAYEEAAHLKQSFLATASHELRSPLNGVLAGIQLLARTDLSSEQDEIFTIIQQAGVTLSHIIDDLLMYTKLGANKLTLVMDSVDIRAIVRNLVSTYQLQSQNTKLSYHIDESVPHYSKGDPIRFTQILSNIIDNANKFTFSGEIKVAIRAKKMPETNFDKFKLFVTVTDTGIGMDKLSLKKLFQPFAQVDTSTNKRPGTGLGLSISRDLIKLMDGEINVKSVVDQGTEITYSLTLGRGDKPRPSVGTASTISVNENTKILIAEDNVVNAKLLTKLLKKFGYTNIDHVANGLQAVHNFMTDKPDIILMDIHMPLMDGFEATREIRKRNTEIPIIALSANAAPEDRKASLDAGMNGHVSKPFQIEKLIALIKKLTNHQE